MRQGCLTRCPRGSDYGSSLRRRLFRWGSQRDRGAPKRQREGCPGGHWSLILRWAGAERPKGPRAGGDAETGGRQHGSDTPAERADLSSNWRRLRSTRASCEPGGAAPLRAPRPRGRGRGPGRPLTPCSLALSITHTRAPPAATRPSQEETRGEGDINRERAKGQTPHPRPPACTHWQKPKHNLERPRRFQGPRRAQSLDRGKAPSRGAASPRGAGQALPRQSHGHVWERKARQSEDQLACPRAPGRGPALHGTQRCSPSVGISGSPARSQSGQPRPGAQDGHPPGPQAVVPLSRPPGLARADSATGRGRGRGVPGPAAPGRPSVPPGSAPVALRRRRRGGVRGAYLSAPKCPSVFLPV